jgi:hypothetical protein
MSSVLVLCRLRGTALPGQTTQTDAADAAALAQGERPKESETQKCPHYHRL